MCAFYCEVGTFTEEAVKKATIEYQPREFFIDWVAVSLDNNKTISRYKNEDNYELDAIKKGLKLKQLFSNERVLVHCYYSCSGTEQEWALEVLSENKIKVLYSGDKYINKLLEENKQILHLSLIVEEMKEDYDHS